MIFALLLLLPLLGAVVTPLMGKKSGTLRDFFLRLFTLCQFALTVWLFYDVVKEKEFTLSLPGWLGLGLSFRADGFRALYALLPPIALAAGMTAQAVELLMALALGLGACVFVYYSIVVWMFPARDYPWGTLSKTRAALTKAR